MSPVANEADFWSDLFEAALGQQILSGMAQKESFGRKTSIRGKTRRHKYQPNSHLLVRQKWSGSICFTGRARFGLHSRSLLDPQVCGIICTAEIGQNASGSDAIVRRAHFCSLCCMLQDETYAIGPSYNGEAVEWFPCCLHLVSNVMARCGPTSSTLGLCSGRPSFPHANQVSHGSSMSAHRKSRVPESSQLSLCKHVRSMFTLLQAVMHLS